MDSSFSAVKNTSNPPPTKVAKFIYVPKNKCESSSKKNEDLKSISVHPNFLDIVKEPFATNEFLDFLPRSLIISKNKKPPKGYKFSTEELHTKDDNT